MNYEEVIIFERVYIRRRWWQNQRPSPPPGENPGGNQGRNNEANRIHGQAQNLNPQNEGFSAGLIYFKWIIFL